MGWYVVITQDCDIVRDPNVEPWLVVCPLRQVTLAYWQALRSGPGSLRELPFPDGHRVPTADGVRPIADLRFVTNVDKTALLHPSVQSLRPLPGPQRFVFGRWVGARCARVPHPDVLECDVLPKAAGVVTAPPVQGRLHSTRGRTGSELERGRCREPALLVVVHPARRVVLT